MILSPSPLLSLDQIFGYCHADNLFLKREARQHDTLLKGYYLLSCLTYKLHPMKETEMNVLEIMLDNLVVAVFEHKDRLLAQTEVQDVKIESIWNAYNWMGITFPHYSENLLGPIQSEMKATQKDTAFFEKYERTDEELNLLLGQLKDRDNPMEILNQTEKLIVDLLILLHFQWEIVTAKFKPVVKKVRAVKDAELALIAEYKNRKPSLNNHPSRLAIEQEYGMQQQQLIAEQIELFSKEKDILNELQVICDERGKLLIISSELFLR